MYVHTYIADKEIRGFFHARDHARSPQGGLTMGRSAEGRSPLVEQSVGIGVPTHTPGPQRSPTGCSPLPRADRDCCLCWQLTLLPLQMLPQPFPRRAWPMTVVRRWFLYAPAVEPEIQKSRPGLGRRMANHAQGGVEAFRRDESAP